MRGHFENLVVVDTDQTQGALSLFQYQEQFLALVIHTDNVYLSDVLQVIDGLAPVQHGRQLENHLVGFLHQEWQQFQDVGRAVLDVIGATAMFVATGRV